MQATPVHRVPPTATARGPTPASAPAPAAPPPHVMPQGSDSYEWRLKDVTDQAGRRLKIDQDTQVWCACGCGCIFFYGHLRESRAGCLLFKSSTMPAAPSLPHPWCVGVPAVTRPPSYKRGLQVVFFEPQRPTDWMKVYGRVDARGQVVKMERNTEKGLFAALDQKLKAEKVRLKVRVPGGLLARRGVGQEGGEDTGRCCITQQASAATGARAPFGGEPRPLRARPSPNPTQPIPSLPAGCL